MPLEQAHKSAASASLRVALGRESHGGCTAHTEFSSHTRAPGPYAVNGCGSCRLEPYMLHRAFMQQMSGDCVIKECD